MQELCASFFCQFLVPVSLKPDVLPHQRLWTFDVLVKECASYLWKSISQLRSVTCHMGSHSVTCHPTQAKTPRLYASPTGWYSIYRPFKDGGLSKPRPRVQRATRLSCTVGDRAFPVAAAHLWNSLPSYVTAAAPPLHLLLSS